MEHSYLITKIFNTDITINLPSVVTTLVTMTITFLLAVFLTSRVKFRPDSKRQNLVEILAVFVRDNIIKGNISWTKYGKGLWSLGLSLILFLMVANSIGVILDVSFNGVVYINSVTADPTFTFTLAITFILFTHYFSLKHKGIKHYLGTYTSEGKLLSPFKVIEEFTNLLTLSMRLYGNIFAGEVLMYLLGALCATSIAGAIFGVLGLVVWKGFSLFVGIIQSYIFTILVFSYLSHKVNDEH